MSLEVRVWRLLALVVGVWLAAGGWRHGARTVAERFGPADPAEEGELVRSVPGVLVVARRERLLASPAAGWVEPVAGEGQSVAAGAVVAYIRSSAQGRRFALRAPYPGVVSYYADGQESWEAATRALASPPAGPPAAALRSLIDSQPVASGQPVVRLVDGTELRAVFVSRTDPSQPSLEVPGRGATVYLTAPGDPVGLRATVLEVRSQADTYRALLALERQPPDWLYRRQVEDVRLVVHRMRGVIVPASALDETGQRLRVWVQTPQGAVAVPVELVGRVGQQVVVHGLPQGVRVYRWPRWLASR